MKILILSILITNHFNIKLLILLLLLIKINIQVLMGGNKYQIYPSLHPGKSNLSE
jgi:hypothetical protein